MSATSCGCGGACGCCESPSPAAPLTVYNAPGLPSVGYRIGTYPSFREALIEQLAGELPLRALTTRDPSDYGIAVLDSWAYLADILTFYSERTINEAFLRTAKLRDSVVRLAGMVGYEPSPGLAATAPLAFTAEGGSFTLTAGARVQSSPAPGDTNPPAKFETLSDVLLTPGLSALPVSAVPEPASQLAAGSAGGPLSPGATVPAGIGIGTQVVAYSVAGGTLERKRVTAVGGGGVTASVSFAPPLAADADAVAVPIGATMHAFGYGGPATWVKVTGVSVTSGNPPSYTLTQESATVTLAASDTLMLDAVYPNVGPGDQVVVSSIADGFVALLDVTAAGTVSASLGTSEASVTQLTLSEQVGPFSDLHTLEITVLGSALPFWGYTISGQISDATVVGIIDPAQAPLNGQAIVLADASGVVQEASVVSSAASSTLPGGLEIQFTPGLSTPLDGATAVLYGNVVTASQGETVTGELLGSGDATIPGQIFPISKVPVTYVPQAGSPHGAQSTLVVWVGGVQWNEVPYLYGSGPDDRVYVVERADDGSYTVRFGDGVIGARLPSGAQVTADYRSGLGVAGNVGAGLLRLPLTRPTGLVSVFNPLAAGGGNDPETLDEARANAPSTVRTLERIVSLQDFADQALENALVAKASAAWTPLGAGFGVSMIVAGPAGATLGGDQLSELRADLDARRDANVQLQLQGYRPVAISITVRILASDPDLRAQDVANAVQAALLDAFSFAARSFGQPVRLSEVFVAAQNVSGVLGVEVERFTLADPLIFYLYWLTPDPVQQRIDLDPDQLATLSADDVTVVSS
jgi:hypothetical protein